MNRIDKLFAEKRSDILNIYFTAGYPQLNDTMTIVKALDNSGADLIEIGMPFSDPVADGPVIQRSSEIALKNGMSVEILFKQLAKLREITQIPIILMGYINPVLQYGIVNFCCKCEELGIDGLILPDLPPELYTEEYQEIFEEYDLHNILLAPPQTSDERLKTLDELTKGFLYVVAASSTTGAKGSFEKYQVDYFERLKQLNLKKPRLIGFGISNHETFTNACKYANGAIIGSAFIKILQQAGSNLEMKIEAYIKMVKEGKEE